MEKIINGQPYTLSLNADPTTGLPVSEPPFDLSLIAAAAQIATQATADQTNVGGRGVKVLVNITAIGTGSITVQIQGKDPASGAYYTILASAALVANALTVLEVYPGIAAVANLAANAALPRVWRVNVVSNNANPVAYTLGATVTR